MIGRMEQKKIYYSMGEVAEMFGVSQSLIRTWDKMYPELKPDTNKKGNRLFRPADVETFRIIYHLAKVKGFKHAAIRKYLKTGSLEGVSKESLVVEKLMSLRALIEETLAQIERSERNEREEVIFEAPLAEEPETKPRGTVFVPSGETERSAEEAPEELFVPTGYKTDKIMEKTAENEEPRLSQAETERENAADPGFGADEKGYPDDTADGIVAYGFETDEEPVVTVEEKKGRKAKKDTGPSLFDDF